MEENYSKKLMNATGHRLITIRFRTWALTIAIIITLGFYLLVDVITKQTISLVDFILLVVVQIIVHSLYFPDGDLFGQKDKAFIANKSAYNEKATEINLNRQISKLREYCKFEFEERKKRYVVNQLGKLELTENEFELLKEKSEKDIKTLECFEFKEVVNGEEKSRLIFFSRHKRKILYNLLFKPLPVEENYPETIMSAVENNGNRAIRDGSIGYKVRAYIRRILKAVVVGGIFAYIGYKVKDGVGWAEIVSISMYLTTLFSTAVLSFSSGENCSRVYKSHFYLDLSNFIDGFNEWNNVKTIQQDN